MYSKYRRDYALRQVSLDQKLKKNMCGSPSPRLLNN